MRGRVVRWRAFFVAATVVLGTATVVQTGGSVAAAAVPDTAADEVTAAAYAREGDKQVEVASETTETTQVLANPDGSWTMTQYVHPVRVKQGAAWVAVDSTLVQRSDGTIGPKAAAIDLALNPGGTGSAATPIVKAGAQDKAVGLKWTADLPKPRLEGDTATYAEVLPGVDLTVKAATEGYTENLVIKTADAAKNPKLREVAFGLYTKNTSVSVAEGEGRGTPAQPKPTDGLQVTDGSGKVLFAGDASRMWDSSGVGSPAEQQLGEGGGRREAVMDFQLAADKVTIAPDQSFLDDPATRYPVSLDPDNWCTSCGIQSHVVVQSGYPDAHNWNASTGDLSDLKAGYEDYDRAGTSRSYIQMNTSRLGGTVIHSATLNTTVLHSYSCSPRPTGLWISNPADPGTTWNLQPGWSYHVSDMNVANCHDAGNVAGQFDATGAARDAAANYWQSTWFVLAAANEGDGTAAWRRFALNPYFQVNYNSYPNPPANLSMQRGLLPCVTGPNRPWVFTKTPQLAGQVSDPDGGTVLAKFGVAFGAVGHNVYSHDNGANLVAVGTAGPNQRATAQLAAVPAGWINDDGVYNWSMQATDGELWTNWVGNCEFTVDSKAPHAPSVTMTGTPPVNQGDTAAFSVRVDMATAGLYDIDHFIFTTDGSEPQVQGSLTAPATQGTDAGGALIATTNLSTTAVNGNQNLIRVKAVNKAGTPGPVATCVADGHLDGPSCSYHVQPVTPGTNLAAAWSLDETGGTTAADTASTTPGNSGIAVHNAALNGGAAWSAGYNQGNSWSHPDANGYGEGAKGALSLDGTSGFAQTPGPVLDATKSFSVGAWVKLTDTTHSQTVLAQDGTLTDPFLLQYNKESNAWVMRMTTGDNTDLNDARAIASGAPQLGVWTHLTATYDAKTNIATLYVNGVKQGTTAAHPWAASGPMLIGASKWNGSRIDYFHGQIDDAQVWQRVLSASDVHDFANVGVLVAAYGLAEGCGPELTSATSRVPSQQVNWQLNETNGAVGHDTSAFGNDVSMSGGYSWVPGHSGGAVHFDGATGTGTSSGPAVNTAGSYTVSAWVKPDDLNGTYTVLTQPGSHAENFVLRYAKDAGHWVFGINSADDAAATMRWAVGTSTPSASTWTMLSVVFDADAKQARLYVDGKREATVAAPAAWGATGNALLGAEPGAVNLFKGAVDQVGVWATGLNDDQIAAMAGYSYYESVGQRASSASGGVQLAATPDAGGNPTACAAQFDNSWSGQVDVPKPANFRTDKSFTVEAWVSHTWTTADVSAVGAVDPYARAVAGGNDAQYSPFLLGYRAVADSAGKLHGKWSFLLSTSATSDGAWYALSDADVVDNTWTHLAVSYDATTHMVTLYVNDVKQNFFLNTQDGGGVSGRDGSGGLFLGRGIWGGNRSDEWYGRLAGVRVYSGVRGTAVVGNDRFEDDPRQLFAG
ncbi:LamG-like jellyroll fold domain-containing protein [Amycolatopsis halotolerans]|uniref:LamG-like jellyroll fold domain-containing protein n=1 Tax=Amycolatopsis halotolerans TaxID=330083 RepID=A0ABV7QKC1_9PSEU